MKTNWVLAGLACAALAFTSTAAFAKATPISDTPIGLEHDPQGIMANGTTDSNGSVTFRGLTPGKYILRIDGQGLVRAMDKLQKAAPAKSEGSSVSLGLGGMFGGSKRSAPSHQGAGPVDSTHNSTSSSTGVGADVSVPVAGSGPAAQSVNDNLDVTLEYRFRLMIDGGGSTEFSASQGYCPDAASKGASLGFSVPPGPPATVVMTIFDRWGN